jgi:hypothetical protein
VLSSHKNEDRPCHNEQQPNHQIRRNLDALMLGDGVQGNHACHAYVDICKQKYIIEQRVFVFVITWFTN